MVLKVVLGCTLVLQVAGASSLRAQPAESIVLRVFVEGDGPRPVPSIVRIVDSPSSSESLEIQLQAPGVVDLPWSQQITSRSIQVAADGYWSSPTVLAAGEAPSSAIEQRLWPATTLVGKVTAGDGIPLPRGIALRLESHDTRTLPRFGRTTLVCPIDDKGGFRCPVPRRRGLDLRFRIPGFASRFFWDQNLNTAGPSDIGTLRLIPGASVVGNLEVGARVDVEDVEIILEPIRTTMAGAVLDTASSTRAVTSADERGFFSFEGLAPGAYRLTARHPELAPGVVEPIRVLEGAQSKLDAPIVLSPAEPLRIAVNPITDPAGGDWAIAVFESKGPGSSLSDSARLETTVAGFAVFPSLPLGSYGVRVLDSSGATMSSTHLLHEADHGIHAIPITTIRVEGTLHLGEEPLIGQLTFRRLDTRRETESEADGKFMATLPEDGSWDVEVKAPVPAVRWRRANIPIASEAGVATLELSLPDTHLSGRVVDENGDPQEGALVTATDSPWEGRAVTVRTIENGKFDLFGLEESTYSVQAEKGDRASLATEVGLREEARSDLDLILRPKKSLRGRVVDAAANAVPGVSLLVEPYTSAGILDGFYEQGQTVSDLQGHFELTVPPSAATVALTFFAPGYAIRYLDTKPGEVGEVVLSSAAGTLRLTVPEPVTWTDPSSPRPALVHADGHKVVVGTLLHWASLNGILHQPESVIFTIPGLGPGTYRVCWVRPHEWASRLTPGVGCAGGDLASGNTLALSLVDPPTATDP